MKHDNQNNDAPIRNIVGFTRSYLKSQSGQKALTRQPSFRKVTAKDKKGSYEYRVFKGSNQLAEAFAAAI